MASLGPGALPRGRSVMASAAPRSTAGGAAATNATTLPPPALTGLARYEKLCKCGGGMYGDVFKARDRVTGRLVAMKRIKLQTDDDDGSGMTGAAEDDVDGIPSTALREIVALREVCPHPNVVSLLDVVFEMPGVPSGGGGSSGAAAAHSAPRPAAASGRPQLYLIFEYIDRDLKRYLQEEQELRARAAWLARAERERRAAGLPGSAPSTASDMGALGEPPARRRGAAHAPVAAPLGPAAVVGAAAATARAGGEGPASAGASSEPSDGLPLPTVRSFMWQLLRGLAALHAKRLVHR